MGGFRISLTPVPVALISTVLILYLTSLWESIFSDPQLMFTVSSAILISLTPYAVESYILYSRQRYIESRLPLILASIESLISSGETVAEAIAEAFTRHLQRYRSILKTAIQLGYPVSEAVRRIVGGYSPALRMFTAYIDILLLSGENAYDTIPRLRLYLSKLHDLKARVSSHASAVFTVAILTYLAIVASIYISLLMVSALPIDPETAGLLRSHIASMAMLSIAVSSVASAVIFGRISMYAHNRFLILTIPIAIAVNYMILTLYTTA